MTTTFLHKLAASKAATITGLVIGTIPTVCLTMPSQIDEFSLRFFHSADYGHGFCAFVAIVAFFVTAVGRGLADRRPPLRQDVVGNTLGFMQVTGEHLRPEAVREEGAGG